MRILHTEWSDGWGGQERRILSEMMGMRAAGHELLLATRPGCTISTQASAAGFEVVHLPFSGSLDWRTIWPLRTLLRQRQVTVVNTHSGKDAWTGGLAARLAKTPVLVRTRHLNLPLRRNPVNFIHYLPDRLIACGEPVRRNLTDHCGFPAAQVVSIPTGIDFDRFQPGRHRTAVRAELAIPATVPVVLMVAVIRAVKRHEVGLRAFHHLLARFPDAHLVLAGDGPMRTQMHDLAAALGLGGQIHFLGHRDDVPDLMGMADLLLLTSRSEGVPQVITQALGVGLPVVATQVGGVPELIIHEQTGLLAPPEAVDTLADCMTRLLIDQELAQRLAGAGRQHARHRFSLDAMVQATVHLYREILADKGLPHLLP
ncbi:MAG: glycosyltransferase family 4 protein [Magnetococcus sp. DMHC-8]